MTRVAIVILNWNGQDFLQRFLPKLLEYTPLKEAEIVVADNASTDDSLSFLEENYSNIKLLRLDQNYGFAGGYNKALEHIDVPYFLLLNSDIEVTENWLEPLVLFMDQHKAFAACSPQLLDYYRRDFYEYAGAAGGYIDTFGYTFCRGRIFNRKERVDPGLKDPSEVFWTSGACMLIRSEAFKKAGGFDTHFFAHMEEIDLCWRLRNRGFRLAMVPESAVYHVGGGTLPKSNPFKTYLNFRNNLLMLYKNLPAKQLKRKLFIRKLMDALSVAMFMLSFKLKDIAAIYRAHQHFNKDRKQYRSYREQEASIHGYPDLYDIYKKSVVVDYFLLGRKTFGRLRDKYAAHMNSKTIEINE